MLIGSITVISGFDFVYSDHFTDEAFWEKKYKKLVMETKELRHQVSNLEIEIDKLKIQSQVWEDDFVGMLERADNFERLYEESKEYSQDLYGEYQQVNKDSKFWKNEYDKSFEYGADLYDELQKPKTVIQGTEIEWTFNDSKGNSYTWSMPVKTYEDLIPYSYDKSVYQSKITPKYLELDDGSTISTVNLDGFILESFSNVVDDIYDNSKDNTDFIFEVWYVVSQLTVYDLDIDSSSEGRYALETFSRGGGDCEDLSILIADMLKSSKHTKDWKFQYIYFDINNPSRANTVNHLILFVDDGQYSYHIEATAEPRWDYYPNGISGWYFDI